ncbi:MAG: alpha/beta hydrolase [Gemmatimonadales bacterium]
MTFTASIILGGACSASSTGPGGTESNRFFASGSEQISYAVDLPTGSGPFPAVVLVHGSGAVTKEEMTFFSNLFKQHGYAVLRYDKRGVGQSQGEYRGVSIANSGTMIPLLAQDASAAISVLLSRSDIRHDRIGLAGGSQAGWIIPLSLANTPAYSFAVILSGPTTSVGREIFYSDLAENTTLPLDAAYAQLKNYSGPAGFDPIDALSRVNVPVFWLYGDVDRSIPVRECIEINQTLRQSGKTQFTTSVYGGLDHSLSAAIWNDIYSWLDRLK